MKKETKDMTQSINLIREDKRIGQFVYFLLKENISQQLLPYLCTTIIVAMLRLEACKEEIINVLAYGDPSKDGKDDIAFRAFMELGTTIVNFGDFLEECNKAAKEKLKSPSSGGEPNGQTIH